MLLTDTSKNYLGFGSQNIPGDFGYNFYPYPYTKPIRSSFGEGPFGDYVYDFYPEGGFGRKRKFGRKRSLVRKSLLRKKKLRKYSKKRIGYVFLNKKTRRFVPVYSAVKNGKKVRVRVDYSKISKGMKVYRTKMSAKREAKRRGLHK